MKSSNRAGLEGFLNVSKPYGWTSHDVVQLVRKLTGVRRVGHAGTLDPAAAGVLVVAIGRATRLVDFAADHEKSYCGDVVLGAATNTDDADGSVLYARDPSSVALDQVVAALAGFLGEIEQLPPQFSAVKLKGEKAYEIARRGGAAELAPRRVNIKDIVVVGWEPPVVSLLVRCSKGTYIRSLARDLGEKLGVGGHLGALVRLASGPFTCDDSVGVEDLRMAAEFGYLERLIWPPDVAVAHLPAIIVSPEHARDMRRGSRWPMPSARPSPMERAAEPGPRPPGPGPEGRLVRVYSDGGEFLGLAEPRDGAWQPRLVVSEGE